MIIYSLSCQRQWVALVVSFINIAKGTTDPRVEFITQVYSSQFTNLDQIIISESRLSISFKISTKHQHLESRFSTKSKAKILTKPSFRILTKIQLRNHNQTSAVIYWPNFSFKILTNLVLKVWTKFKLYDQTSASKSAINCCQHDPHHLHQQQ